MCVLPTAMAPKRAAAKAAEEPAAKKARGAPKAKAKARVTEEDLDKELNDMIQHAKDAEFDKVFKILDKYPPYVNEKPEVRMFCTIHQACYHGDLAVVKKLVEKYNADIHLPTKDDKTPAQVAEENGHTEVVKYLKEKLKKLAPVEAVPAGGRNANADRNRVTATRNDGGDCPDLELLGVKQVTLKLGCEGGSGILCGAALVYNGDKKEGNVCICERKFGKAITHSGDTTEPDGRRTHTIKINLSAMPKANNKIFLTLCSCGPANLSKFKNPSVELLGDDEPMIRYNLSDAGTARSTVMVALEKEGAAWKASPVGAVSAAKFCGNYKAAEKLIASGGDDDGVAAAGPGKKGPMKAAKKAAGGGDLAGKIIVFTGTLTMARAAATAAATAKGAKVNKTVSGTTNIVVIGPGAGEKEDLAKMYGCTLWTEDDFKAAVE